MSFATKFVREFQFRSKKILSENNVTVPILKVFRFYAILLERGGKVNFFSVRVITRYRQLSLLDFQKEPQKVGTENSLKRLVNNFCEKISSLPTDLFLRFCLNDSAGSLFPATTTQLFSESLSSHTIRTIQRLRVLQLGRYN